MDLSKLIQELRAQKEVIEHAIAKLEELQNNESGSGVELPKRRGRKSMSASERQEVGERMRQYWANRRTVKLNRSKPKENPA